MTKPEATPGDRIDFRKSGQPEEPNTLKEKEAQVFLISSLMTQVSKSPNKSTMTHDFINNHFTEKKKPESLTILNHLEIQNLMLNRAATWNDMKFQRSKIVLNAQYAFNTKDQAKHVVLVEACYMALPRRSRSRHRNEPTVDSSCTSLAFTT